MEVVGFGKEEEKGKREELIAIIKSYIRLKASGILLCKVILKPKVSVLFYLDLKLA